MSAGSNRAELVTRLPVMLPQVQQLSQSASKRDIKDLSETLISGTGNNQTDSVILSTLLNTFEKKTLGDSFRFLPARVPAPPLSPVHPIGRALPCEGNTK